MEELQMWTGLKEFVSFLGCQVLAFLIITTITVMTYLSGTDKKFFISFIIFPLKSTEYYNFRNPQ